MNRIQRQNTFFILIVILFLLKVNIYSQDTISCNSKNKIITSRLLIFEDSKSELDIKDIIKLKDKDFKKVYVDIPSFSFTKSTVWGKFYLKNNIKKEGYIYISPNILNELTLYYVYPDGKIDSIQQGTFNQKNKTLKINNYAFKCKSEVFSYYLKIKTNTRLFFSVEVLSYDELLKKAQTNDLIHGIYSGLVLIIFLYNLFLYFTTKEKVFFYYILHLINSILFFLYQKSYGIEFFWTNCHFLIEHYVFLLTTGFTLSILFVINFLETREKAKTLHKLLILSIVAFLVFGVLDLLGYTLIAIETFNKSSFFIISIVIIASIKIIKTGFTPAKIFLIAWLSYIIGIATQTLQGLNVIETNQFNSSAIIIGSSIEIILLSLAVGFKINFYKKARIQAIEEQTSTLKEKEKILSKQNENLEIQTLQKSTEIVNKNKLLQLQKDEILLKNLQIKEQNTELLTVNSDLEIKNIIITNQNIELKNRKDNLELIVSERTAELAEATKIAEDSDNEKTAFLKNFSHEIRTPMNAIAGFSSLLREVDFEDKRHDYYVSVIIENTDNLLNLIENIVDLSNLHSGNLKLKNVRFDPKKIFNSMFIEFSNKIKTQNKSFITIKLDVPSENNYRLFIDYNRFEQIVFHLVDNAIKYTESGIINFGYKFVDENKKIMVFVKDTGIGIQQKKLNFIFDIFRKTKDNNIKFYSGTGLGLALVKGLVSLMEGEIELETKSKIDFPDEESGSEFKIYIPVN